MADSTRANLTKGSTWTRLLYIVLFGIAFKVAGFVIAIITFVQFVTALISGGPANRRLQEFGEALALYLQQVVAFLTYATEEKPYPIGPWPTNVTAPDTKPGAAQSARPKTATKAKPKSASKSAPKTASKSVIKTDPDKP